MLYPKAAYPRSSAQRVALPSTRAFSKIMLTRSPSTLDALLQNHPPTRVDRDIAGGVQPCSSLSMLPPHRSHIVQRFGSL
uniref:Uncharacterized protein n=1 Tax=Aegilops tauschii subsp. strangulata TaxID=200361 RepID=A0A453NCW8_AEGTS